jgi:hypothetical protein
MPASGRELPGLIGWQGLRVQVPADWDIAAISGDWTAGYLRIDDREATRAEIKWAQSQVNTSKALDTYLRQLKKKTRGRVEIERGVKVVSKRSQPDKSLSGFSWQSEQGRARGVIWRCRHCGRTVIAQVMGRGDENVEALARDVLTTLQDHPVEGVATWAAYGLVVQIPGDFRLESQRLMAAYIEMVFAERKRRLRVTRWGMASLQLAEASLSDWLAYQYRTRRDIVWKAEPVEIRGHQGLLLDGHVRRRFHGTRRLLEGLVRWRRPVAFQGQVWHCPESERVFGVDCVAREGEAGELAAQVAESIPCHRSE